ncbi:hypothetical protein H4R33_003310 [Dimargaris cristalligena]|nr:hypothetical protein H4R33_003310 [Dimargaris cristalligena]
MDAVRMSMSLQHRDLNHARHAQRPAPSSDSSKKPGLKNTTTPAPVPATSTRLSPLPTPLSLATAPPTETAPMPRQFTPVGLFESLFNSYQV